MAIDLRNGHAELKRHVGHEIQCVSYGDGQNIAIECDTCSQVLLEYEKAITLTEGDRIRLKRDVERFPHFIARKGLTCKITEVSDDIVIALMDEEVKGSEEWDNDLMWSDDQLAEISGDVEVIATPPPQ